MAKYTCTVAGTPNGFVRARAGAGVSYAEKAKLKDGTTFTSSEQKTLSNGEVWYKNDATGFWSCGKTSKGAVYLRTTAVQAPTSTPNTTTTNTEAINTNKVTSTESVSMAYMNQVKELSQRKIDSLTSAVDGSMRLFGLPHQFNPYTDYRISNNTALGRVFMENFILEAPRIFIKPGKSNFLPGLSEDQKKGLVSAIIAGADDLSAELQKVLTRDALGAENIKYFEFEQDYMAYMHKVNMLCRVGAVFLGIHKVRVPWNAKGTNTTFGNYDWANYKFKNTYMGAALVGDQPESELNGFNLKAMIENVSIDDTYVEFYVDSSASYNESSSNSTTQSMLNSVTDNMSNLGKELAFVSGVSDVPLDQMISKASGDVDALIQDYVRGNGHLATFMRRLTGTSNQLLNGSNFLAPDIWSDSDYSKNYSFDITLACPYGNKYSWFLNVYVPLCHILALALPTQTAANTYTTPNLVRAFSPGWFSCDLGIIDSISLDKGGSEAWSVEGFPTTVKVSISIRDLYSNLALPAHYDFSSFFANDNLINFLLVNCGIDITRQDLSTKYQVIANMFMNSMHEKVVSPFAEIKVGIKQAIRNIYGLYT